MAVNDQISDFLTRIRNAAQAQHRYVDVSWSKLIQTLADILKSQGFIESYLLKLESSSRGTVRIFLRYAEHRRPAIQGVKRVSRPGMRRYVGNKEIPRFYGGYGVPIISTSQGVMTGSEASKRGIGGELLCMVW